MNCRLIVLLCLVCVANTCTAQDDFFNPGGAVLEVPPVVVPVTPTESDLPQQIINETEPSEGFLNGDRAGIFNKLVIAAQERKRLESELAELTTLNGNLRDSFKDMVTSLREARSERVTILDKFKELAASSKAAALDRQEKRQLNRKERREDLTAMFTSTASVFSSIKSSVGLAVQLLWALIVFFSLFTMGFVLFRLFVK